MFWYVLPFFILAYDSASTATRSPSAVTPLAVSRRPPSILEASAPATSANCALVFVPERAKFPATHQVAESASAPIAAAPLPALIFSMKPSTIFLFSSTPIMLTSCCRFVGATSATYCRSSCACKRAPGLHARGETSLEAQAVDAGAATGLRNRVPGAIKGQLALTAQHRSPIR